MGSVLPPKPTGRPIRAVKRLLVKNTQTHTQIIQPQAIRIRIGEVLPDKSLAQARVSVRRVLGGDGLQASVANTHEAERKTLSVLAEAHGETFHRGPRDGERVREVVTGDMVSIAVRDVETVLEGN